MKSKFSVGIFLVLVSVFACSPENNNASTDRRDSRAKGLANPAAIKCIKDGYTLETIKENGIPRGNFCVNKETGMRCEIWAYFKGECELVP